MIGRDKRIWKNGEVGIFLQGKLKWEGLDITVFFASRAGPHIAVFSCGILNRG